MEKILITGSNGFVGKKLIKELKKYKIIEFDKNKNLDILNKKDIEKKMKDVNTVIHLAGIIDNQNKLLWDINVKGTENLIEIAKKNKVKKIIYLSSTGVYGFTKEKINEKTKPCPENEYEKSKLEGEKICLKSKIPCTIIRSAMIFGPNKYWEKMIKLLKKDYPLPLDGKNTFQIIYVDNLTKLILKTVENKEKIGIYLASDKEKLTLIDFCNQVKKNLGQTNKTKTIPTFIALIVGKIINNNLITKENIRHLAKERNYDIKKLNELDYNQKYSLKESIKKTIKELNL
jgi:nucleoside-diphosphate-sugar epimerase